MPSIKNMLRVLLQNIYTRELLTRASLQTMLPPTLDESRFYLGRTAANHNTNLCSKENTEPSERHWPLRPSPSPSLPRPACSPSMQGHQAETCMAKSQCEIYASWETGRRKGKRDYTAAWFSKNLRAFSPQLSVICVLFIRSRILARGCGKG